jgi:short-subunit dehydrogenase
MDLQKYGPWALIVGGSEGLGASFARKLAADGFNLVLTARKTGPLDALAEELRAAGAEVRTLSMDLTRPGALQAVRGVTDDIEVGLLIYNAGVVGSHGDFVGQDPEVHRSLVAINVQGQLDFSHHYCALMCERGRGGVILVGSRASYIGSWNLAVYCGVKGFSRIFSEGLWLESQKYGVDVLHLCIGFTATPSLERIGVDTTGAASPDDVAQEGLDNIANGPVWLPGGPAAYETAVAHSRVDNRAETVRASVIQILHGDAEAK